jgi:hypothetical protein
LLGGALVLSLVLIGCKSMPERTVRAPAEVLPAELEGAPDWVSGNCTDHWDEDGQQICGVGSIGGTRNISLARSTAIARGRAEIARSLGVKLEAMLKDYQATTTGGASFGRGAVDEQDVTIVSREITDQTIKGTEPVANWISDSGTYYALVALNLEKFQDAVNRMDAISENVRQAVIERSREAFVELDQQIEEERSRTE